MKYLSCQSRPSLGCIPSLAGGPGTCAAGEGPAFHGALGGRALGILLRRSVGEAASPQSQVEDVPRVGWGAGPVGKRGRGERRLKGGGEEVSAARSGVVSAGPLVSRPGSSYPELGSFVDGFRRCFSSPRPLPLLPLLCSPFPCSSSSLLFLSFLHHSFLSTFLPQ